MNQPEGDETDTDVTLTVGDLIKRLSAFPAETLVLATWEGVFEQIGVVRELCEGKAIIVAEGIEREYFGDYGLESMGNKGHGWY